MSASPPGSAADASPVDDPPLAPRWHTALLVTGMTVLGIAGAWASRQKLGPSEPLPTLSPAFRIFAVYLPMIGIQAAIVFYVTRIGRGRSALRSLLGRGWESARRAAEDVGLAVLGCALVIGGETLWARLVFTHARTAAPVAAVLPQTTAERVGWVLVALSVGFAEELTYRGYLQTQLGAFTKSVPAGIVLSAVLFGLVHGEQGLATAARFAVYGVGFGLLARARRSLVPGIVCHALIDVAGGLLR